MIRNLDPALGLVCFDCLPGVVDDVDEHLLHLVRIHHGLRQLRVEARDDLHVAGAQLVLEDFDRRFDQFVDGGELSFRCAPAGEAEQSLDDLLTPQRALVEHLEITLVLGLYHGVFHQFREAQHRRQWIV
jgi:hypothetical protein